MWRLFGVYLTILWMLYKFKRLPNNFIITSITFLFINRKHFSYFKVYHPHSPCCKLGVYMLFIFIYCYNFFELVIRFLCLELSHVLVSHYLISHKIRWILLFQKVVAITQYEKKNTQQATLFYIYIRLFNHYNTSMRIIDIRKKTSCFEIINV